MTEGINQAAAREAARRLAEEAAKRAAKRAAEAQQREAVKAQQKEAAKTQQKAATERMGAGDRAEGLLAGTGDPAPEAPKPEEARQGFLEKVLGRVKEAASDLAAEAAQARKEKTVATRAELEKLEGAFAKAETPQDVNRLAERSAALKTEAEEAGLDAKLVDRASALDAKAQRAHAAVTELEQARRVTGGTPAEKAAGMARLMSRSAEVKRNLEGLDALKGSPLVAKAKGDLQAAAEATTPEALARALDRAPDLGAYPPETAGDLARLRGADPALDAALDGAAATALEGLSAESLKENPGLGQLIAGSTDPEVQARSAEAAEGWAKEALERHLDGAEGKDETKDAMEAFKTEMTELAEETGLGTAIADGTRVAVEDGKDMIEDHAEEGGGLFGAIKNAVGDVLGDIGDFLGDIGSAVADVAVAVNPVALADKAIDTVSDLGLDDLKALKDGATKLLDGAVGGVGDLVKKGVGAVGTVADAALTATGKVVDGGLDIAAKGLDAVGLDGAANVVDKAGDLYADAADFVGDQAENFMKGAGDALGGTVAGLGQMALHPVQTVKAFGYLATHPGQLKEVGKALWKEGTKHGVAGAIGYVAGNLAPAILTGGGSAAGLVGKGGQLANAASKMGRMGTLATGAGKTMIAAGRVMQHGAKGMKVLKELSTAKFSQAVRTMGTPTRTLVKEGAQAATDTLKNQAGSSLKGARALVSKNTRQELHEATLKRADLTPEMRAAITDRGGNRLFATKAERALEKQAVSNKHAAAMRREALEQGKRAKAEVLPGTRLKRIRQVMRSDGLSPEQKAAKIAEQLDKAHFALRGKAGYRVMDRSVKLGAETIKLVTDPIGFVTKRMDGASRLLRKDIRDAISATGVTLTPTRQIAHDLFARFAAQITQTEEFKEAKKAQNELVREAALSTLAIGPALVS